MRVRYSARRSWRPARGFALQPVDEVDDGIKAASGAAADASPGNGYRQMAFPRTSSVECTPF